MRITSPVHRIRETRLPRDQASVLERDTSYDFEELRSLTIATSHHHLRNVNPAVGIRPLVAAAKYDDRRRQDVFSVRVWLLKCRDPPANKNPLTETWTDADEREQVSDCIGSHGDVSHLHLQGCTRRPIGREAGECSAVDDRADRARRAN